MQEYPERILPTISNNFSNVLEKIQSKNLGNDSAWDEAQALLKHYIPEYPESYKDHLDFIRMLFNLRRDNFRAIDQEASKKATKLILDLGPEKEKLLSPAIICIRDVFDVKAKDRRNQRQLLRSSK